MSPGSRGPHLRSLAVADPPAVWERLGFSVARSRLQLGAVEVTLGARGSGIVGCSIAGLDASVGIDRLPIALADHDKPEPGVSEPHPNGAIGIDHVVLVSPDFERTADSLNDAGLPLRRVTAERGIRQGFRRLGPAILELVDVPEAERVHLWGLTVIVESMDALSERLGERLGPVKPAVQPGRRIATVRSSAGLSTAMAFMDPPSVAT